MDYEGISIEKVCHSCFRIKGSKLIYIDPFRIEKAEVADIVFITHPHFDHCSPDDLKKVCGPGTTIVTVADCQSKVSSLEVKDVIVMGPTDSKEVEGLMVDAVAAYNTNKPNHPKENGWVGFVINLDGKRIYHAGDADLIPEMADLVDIDVAMLPASGKFVMDAKEAAEAAGRINPKLAIPMHYGVIVGTEADADEFEKLCTCRVEKL